MTDGGKPLVLAGGRVLDPSRNIDSVGDVLIVNGRIEAVATSMILKMSDDIVITVSPDGTGARVDMRSASRTGHRDLGENAQRIRAFLAELATQAR